MPSTKKWVCPVCSRENRPEDSFCLYCGFDSSVDYRAYPSLTRPGRRQLTAQTRTAKGKQRRRKRAVSVLAAALLFLGISLVAICVGISAGETTLTNGIAVTGATDNTDVTDDTDATDDAEPIDAADDTDAADDDSVADHTLGAAQASVPDADSTEGVANAYAEASSSGGVLDDMLLYESFRDGNTLSLDNVTRSGDITEIYFLNTLADAPADATDLSAAGDGSALCWTEGTVQYIAGEGGVVGGSSCANMFADYVNVTAIHFSGFFDTSHVTSMSGMFLNCLSLTSLDLSGWDTSSVTDVTEMFSGCSALTSLDVSGWDTSHVTDMFELFFGCSSFTTLDLSDWDTSSVTDMDRVFEDCIALTTLNLSGWDTSHVTSMGIMFSHCSSLTSLDLSDWDTSSLMYTINMFEWCGLLTSLDLSGWDTSNVVDMSGMFAYCYSLTDFDPNWLDTSSADTERMYYGTQWE